MMRSMFAGVSGLRNHQTRMDVIGNNIANVNTIGYKKSRVTFQDMLSQNIRGASSPTTTRGGTNPMQVGLGMTINTIDTIHTQGSSETTGKVTDMMVDGDGFFIVGDGMNRYYTRAGNFDFDALGNLVYPNGLKVQGWLADNTGKIDTSTAIQGITIPKGQSIQPKQTANIDFINNLDAGAAIGTVRNVSIEVYDSLGNLYTIPATFTKSNTNEWTFDLGTLPSGITSFTLTNNVITFNPDGTYNSPAPGTSTLNLNLNGSVGASTPITVKIDFTKLTQFNGSSNADMNSQDGYPSGVLNGYAIDKSGIITGRFSNGLTKPLAQVALANFNNPAGLMKAGENLYVQSNNSGNAQIGAAGSGGRGNISPGQLEMSNVDLSQEFTDMIITQRGFQANSRIITVSDEMLQELVNLKR
ncbi:flagellar hook-basal body protein [Thermincola ferriacetica]|uniref:Flagellar hook protein FlgE n=1 Tax=Thermincola ferriacetica TaxID=281456 RepID=A0A0L6W704_9FIRM|nr:flagellar hook protein FlgE [Thermincola ferriacetica]KNZ70879.1 flagellar hook-basal body protein [Thermincola ferriacetica]